MLSSPRSNSSSDMRSKVMSISSSGLSASIEVGTAVPGLATENFQRVLATFTLFVPAGPRDDFGWNQAHAVAAEALKAAGQAVEPEIVKGVALPVVALLAVVGMRYVRRSVAKEGRRG